MIIYTFSIFVDILAPRNRTGHKGITRDTLYEEGATFRN